MQEDGNLNTLGVTSDGTLQWSLWIGNQWWPKFDSYYPLGNTSDPYSGSSAELDNDNLGKISFSADQVVIEKHRVL